MYAQIIDIQDIKKISDLISSVKMNKEHTIAVFDNPKCYTTVISELLLFLPSKKYEHARNGILTELFEKCNVCLDMVKHELVRLINDNHLFFLVRILSRNVQDRQYLYVNLRDCQKDIFECVTDASDVHFLRKMRGAHYDYLCIMDRLDRTPHFLICFIAANDSRVQEKALAMLHERVKDKKGTFDEKWWLRTNRRLMKVLSVRNNLDRTSLLCLDILNYRYISNRAIEKIKGLFALHPLRFLEHVPLDVDIDKTALLRLLEARDWSARTCNNMTIRDIVYSNLCALDEDDIFHIIGMQFTNDLSDFFISLRVMNYKVFVALCIQIANQPSFKNCINYIKCIKTYKRMAIIDEWKSIKKMETLMLRIYPLVMKDREWYFGLMSRMEREWQGECLLIRQYYGLSPSI